MVIYEVNLVIDIDIYPQFQSWLLEHVREMLEFPGFIKASILKPEEEVSDKAKLTVQYQLENRKFLEMYFTEFADQMREKGLRLFKNKLSAERRIFELERVLRNLGKN